MWKLPGDVEYSLVHRLFLSLVMVRPVEWWAVLFVFCQTLLYWIHINYEKEKSWWSLHRQDFAMVWPRLASRWVYLIQMPPCIHKLGFFQVDQNKNKGLSLKIVWMDLLSCTKILFSSFFFCFLFRNCLACISMIVGPVSSLTSFMLERLLYAYHAIQNMLWILLER